VSGGSLPTLPCACANLRRAARAVTQLYDEALRETGLRATQFTLLQVLSLRSETQQSELGAMLATDSTTLTRTLAPLRERRWIRSRPGDDRRERYWSITDAGQRCLADARPAWETAQRRLKGRIGAERLSALFRDLTEIAGVVPELMRDDGA
jgi:DNA-binding MarR family transcriptional regulator